MVLPALGAIAARVGGTGLLKGAAGKIGGSLTGGKGLGGLLGYVAGAELVKHTLVNPALSATGLYYSPAPAPAPAAGAGMAGPGGMPLNPGQFNRLYGERGLFPWQNQEGFYEQQAREQRQLQRDLYGQSQETLRYGAGLNYNLGLDSNRTRAQMNRDLIGGQLRVAEIGLAGQKDTNKSRVRISEIDANVRLNTVYDTNRRDVRIAGIGANRDRYLADRSVEVARWGGAPVRIATFGGIMGQRY